MLKNLRGLQTQAVIWKIKRLLKTTCARNFGCYISRNPILSELNNGKKAEVELALP